MTVWPEARVWKNANKAPALLDHEDIHYLFAYVLARAMFNEMTSMRRRRRNAFDTVIHDQSQLHRRRRSSTLQGAYDHSAEQGATRLMGYDL